SGVKRISNFDPASLSVKIAAEVRDLDEERYMPARERRHVSRAVILALAASEEAWFDAGIDPKAEPLDARRRIGVIFGSGGGPLEFTERQFRHYFNGDLNKASVYAIPSSTPGTLSSELSMAFNLRGLSHVISTGCTSSTDSLGYAMQHIASGRADVMLVGGSDSPIMPGIMAGFSLMRVL